MFQQISKIVWSVLVLALLSANMPANVLKEQENGLPVLVSLLGDDFIVEAITAPVIENPADWLRRKEGTYHYETISNKKKAKNTAAEEVHSKKALEEGVVHHWERKVGEQLIETYQQKADSSLLIVSEEDLEHGFLVLNDPGIQWPNNIKPGDTWDVNSKLSVIDTEKNKESYKGKLTATHKYIGAWKVKTPAGVFDAVLIHEDFIIKVGPLKAEDDRYYFLTKDLGLVAEIEGVRASAIMVFTMKEKKAKLLKSFPK